MLNAYTYGAYNSEPLELGFRLTPVWSSGPNTYCVPGKDTASTRDFGNHRGRLNIWHTLPVDASALITLWKPEFLRSVGSIWFNARDWVVKDGWETLSLLLRKEPIHFCSFPNDLFDPQLACGGLTCGLDRRMVASVQSWKGAVR